MLQLKEHGTDFKMVRPMPGTLFLNFHYAVIRDKLIEIWVAKIIYLIIQSGFSKCSYHFKNEFYAPWWPNGTNLEQYLLAWILQKHRSWFYWNRTRIVLSIINLLNEVRNRSRALPYEKEHFRWRKIGHKWGLLHLTQFWRYLHKIKRVRHLLHMQTNYVLQLIKLN